MSPAIWVGALDQETLVFDPSLQLPDCPHVFLWTVSRGMQKYVAKLLRTNIRTVKDPVRQQVAIDAFNTWKRTVDTDSWRAAEHAYYAERAAKEAAHAAMKVEAAAAKKLATFEYKQGLASQHEQDLENAEAAEEFAARVDAHWNGLEAGIESDPHFRAANRRAALEDPFEDDPFDPDDLSDRYA